MASSHQLSVANWVKFLEESHRGRKYISHWGKNISHNQRWLKKLPICGCVNYSPDENGIMCKIPYAQKL